MPIRAILDEKGVENRHSPRLHLSLQIPSPLSGGDSTVAIHNLSANGMLIEGCLSVNLGDSIVLALPEAGEVEATVVWQSENLAGCRFSEPLSSGALSAARLRDPPTREFSELARQGPTDGGELLPERLARLRRMRGLSRSELAERAKVSKPTVWAWETGRTAPRRSSLAALARALGVSERNLIAGEASNNLPAVEAPASQPGSFSPAELHAIVEASRERIASAAQVHPDKVRVIIEL